MDVSFVRQGVRFVWNAAKQRLNEERHGVAFEEATEVFFDPFVLVEPESGAGAESRRVAIGLTSDWRMLFVVHLEIGETIRIVSARRASKSQRRRYEDQ